MGSRPLRAMAERPLVRALQRGFARFASSTAAADIVIRSVTYTVLTSSRHFRRFIAIAAGVASMNLLTFTVAAVVGRLLNFAMVAALVLILGPQFVRWIDKYHRWLVGFGLLTALGVGIAWSFR